MSIDEIREEAFRISYEVPNRVKEVMPTPLVSVRTITYNHAPYIRKCLEGLVAQRTDFPVEFIIGEDFSTDGTREIVMEFAARFPDRFRVITADRNVGVLGNGYRTRSIMRGKYCAFCEGDDHWIDPLKLQRQVDALEQDPSASGCFTNVYNETDGVREPYHGGESAVPSSTVLALEEYLVGMGIPTCSVLYRNALMDGVNLTKWGFMTGDTALYTHLLMQGHFIYQPLFTGVRVRHAGGAYSQKGRTHHLRVSIHNRAKQDELTEGRYSAIIQARSHRSLRNAWKVAMHKQDMELAKLAWSHLCKERSIMGWSIWTMLFNGFKVHFPGVTIRLGQLRMSIRGMLGGSTLRNGLRGKTGNDSN